ncbi:hypothetical protein [Hydrogenophaga soli]
MTLRWAQCMLSGNGWQEAWRSGGLMLGESDLPVFVAYLENAEIGSDFFVHKETINGS